MDRGPGSTPSRARPRRLRIALAWASVVAWAGLVWWLGSGDFGAPATSRYLEPLIRWLLPDLSRADVLTLVMAIRKLAHPAVYGVLAGLGFVATRESGVARPLRAAAIAFALAVGVAALDEARQAQLPSRTGSALDVALDATGALAVLGVGVLLTRRGRSPLLEGA